MKYEDITTWSVSKGVATPKNPYIITNDRLENATPSFWGPYHQFEQLVQQHTYVTNAPDGIYSADRFGEIVWQFRFTWDACDNSDDYYWRDASEGDYKRFGCFKDYSQHCDSLLMEARKSLPFIDQVKEAESPKFGEWISVDTPPENRTMVLIYHADGMDLARYKHSCYYLNDGLDRLVTVTHWMPLPSPPKTL